MSVICDDVTFIYNDLIGKKLNQTNRNKINIIFF